MKKLSYTIIFSISSVVIFNTALVIFFFPQFPITIIISTICITGLCIFYLIKKISSPFFTISEITKKIEEGNLEERISFKEIKLLEPLPTSINTMLDSLTANINKLKKLERVRTEFLGNVSHELRTPIFSIQGMIETLLHGAIDDKTVNKDFLRKALLNTERLNTLIADLIDISRIESKEMKLRFRYFIIQELLNSTITELQLLAEKKKIQLYVDCDSSSEVYGDKEKLRQVLTNLIDNAIKYSGNGTTITISCKEKTDTVVLSVSDMGIGIADEHLPRIFERFYRVDKDRSREAGGTGLGLAIVKHIVEAHHSSINVKSELGKGTTFSFEIKKYVSEDRI